MGVYKAEKADSESIVLRHEGDDDHTIEVHAGIAGAAASGPFAPVPGYFLNQVKAGKRYVVSLSTSEVVPYVAPVVTEAAEAVEAFKANVAAGLVPSATEPGQVDQLAGAEAPAPQSQAGPEAADEAPADTGSDQPSNDATAVSEPSPDAGGSPAAPESEA